MANAQPLLPRRLIDDGDYPTDGPSRNSSPGSPITNTKDSIAITTASKPTEIPNFESAKSLPNTSAITADNLPNTATISYTAVVKTTDTTADTTTAATLPTSPSTFLTSVAPQTSPTTTSDRRIEPDPLDGTGHEGTLSASITPTNVYQQSFVSVTASTASYTGPTVAPNYPIQSNQNANHSIVTPIVASIVPITIITACILLWIWWKNGKFWRQKSEDDVERHAVWLTGDKKPTNATANHAVVTEKLNINKGRFFDKTSQRVNLIDVPKRRRSLVISKPTLAHTTRMPSTATNLDDPFLSPVSPTFPPSILPDATFRASQIGLAISTPQHNNTSTVSLGESIRTIIHHTTNMLSNPFRDPSSSVDSVVTQINHGGSTLSPVIEKPTHVKKRNVMDGTEAKGNGEDSAVTPPEELARRWIEVLKLEAAQAEEAAKEASKKAEELRKVS